MNRSAALLRTFKKVKRNRVTHYWHIVSNHRLSVRDLVLCRSESFFALNPLAKRSMFRVTLWRNATLE
jgi:hypothetical protein